MVNQDIVFRYKNFKKIIKFVIIVKALTTIKIIENTILYLLTKHFIEGIIPIIAQPNNTNA